MVAFRSWIDGAQIICEMCADRTLSAPVFCGSGMAPLVVVAGGTEVGKLGSQIEVLLPDMAEGDVHRFVLAYEDAGHRPANRAWLPLGPYLRLETEILRLPSGPSGPKHIGYNPSNWDGPRIIPQPQSYTLTCESLSTNGFACADTVFDQIHALSLRLGFGPFQSPGAAPLKVVQATMPAEHYEIDIDKSGVLIRAGDEIGQFYAGITLLSLCVTHEGKLPCGLLKDGPRFDWRGQHLDCARHFFEVPTILRLLDLMALMKLNRFHWHFADDEAFRVEVECLPDLWQRTRMRGEGEMLPGLFGGGPRAGGSYSKSDVATVIAHARSLNIEVLPEIEVPAHALALGKVFPDLRDPMDQGEERSVQGYERNAVNPAMPAAWDLLPMLATEISQMFPFGHLHLGCDELPADTWLGSPRARDLMDQEWLSTSKDLQGWTMAKLAGLLPDVRVAAWEEAAQGLNGGIGHNALLFSWTGQGPGLEAARSGYDVVMTPAQHVYLDMAHSDDPDDWGANWAAYVSLQDTINWNPVPKEAEDIADRIKGVQGCFWAEFTTQDDELWPMILPRLLGVASKAWHTGDPITGVQLEGLAGHYAPIIAAFTAGPG